MSKANNFLSKFTKDENANVTGPVMAVMGLILVGSILFVGLAVMDGIQSGTALEENDTFYTASASVTDGVSDAFGLTGVLMIIIIAVAVIAALMGILVFVR